MSFVRSRTRWTLLAMHGVLLTIVVALSRASEPLWRYLIPIGMICWLVLALFSFPYFFQRKVLVGLDAIASTVIITWAETKPGIVPYAIQEFDDGAEPLESARFFVTLLKLSELAERQAHPLHACTWIRGSVGAPERGFVAQWEADLREKLTAMRPEEREESLRSLRERLERPAWNPLSLVRTAFVLRAFGHPEDLDRITRCATLCALPVTTRALRSLARGESLDEQTIRRLALVQRRGSVRWVSSIGRHAR